MEKKLTVLSIILVVLCVTMGGGVYYLTHYRNNLKGISCEANAQFTYINNLENSSVPKDIRLVLKMNYVFLPKSKGVLTLTGVASNGDKRYFVNRDMNFSYVAQGDFYRFQYGSERRSARDTLPADVYSYFFNSETNFYHINYLDKDTLMFSNVYSPMFLCNINV
ncbi:FidL-like protein [Serratia inhibens]